MIRAYIDRDPQGFADVVRIVDHCDDATGSHTRVLRVGTDGRTAWEDVDPSLSVEPTLRFDVPDLGRVLLEALTAHYQGAENTRTLRADYMSERHRVDRLIDTLASTASTLAMGATAHA